MRVGLVQAVRSAPETVIVAVVPAPPGWEQAMVPLSRTAVVVEEIDAAPSGRDGVAFVRPQAVNRVP